jgi:hypothetical protein
VAGEEVPLFIDVNKNVYTSPFANALQGNGLRMEEETLRLERGNTQSLHWEGGNSGQVYYSGDNLHELISLSLRRRGWQSPVSVAKL